MSVLVYRVAVALGAHFILLQAKQVSIALVARVWQPWRLGETHQHLLVDTWIDTLVQLVSICGERL